MPAFDALYHFRACQFVRLRVYLSQLLSPSQLDPPFAARFVLNL
jgi:hypothetical protein